MDMRRPGDPIDPDVVSTPSAQVTAEAVVDAAIRRYFAGCRARVPEFVDRHFGIGGAMRLNRRALGRDVLRAPVNVAMIVPTIASTLSAAALKKAGARNQADWLRRRRFFLQTDVAREVEWLIHTELLRLPFRQGGRQSDVDALADEIMADSRVDEPLRDVLRAAGDNRLDAEARDRLQQALGAYAGTRVATGDIANILLAMGTGSLATNQMTLGAFSLGPALAATVAQQVAIASFPLGASLGGAWYGFFPAAPSAALIAGSTGGVMVVAACLAAFSGVVTDPIQRALGLHKRRLNRLIDNLEQSFLREGDSEFRAREHYVSRLADLFDILSAVVRHAH